MRQLRPFDIPLKGVQLVEASAGTGKTYTLTSLYIRALVELPLPVEEILVVTYTKAATKELRDRILKRIRESITALESGEAGGDPFLSALLEQTERPPEAAEKLVRALHEFDRSAVHTIHGFCNQVLQEQAFESGAAFDAEQVEDESEIVREVVDDFWRLWLGEVEEDPWKEPLLRSLDDRRVGPDRLARELGPHTGKPYLTVRPESAEAPEEGAVRELQDAHEEMRRLWQAERPRIHRLMLSEQLSNYREGWVAGWMRMMDAHLASPVASASHDSRLKKFSREELQRSLKKNEDRPAPEHPFFRAVDRFLVRAAELEDLPVWFRKRAFDYLSEHLPARKEELQVYSYDDMLVHVYNALEKGGGSESGLARSLRSRYRLALVDEFQDTDPVQYRIFRTIYGEETGGNGTALFLIGDPKQSIYSFRGADIHSYLEAKRKVPDGRTFGLTRNYRAVPELIEAVNRIFSRHGNPFILEDLSFDPVGPGREEYRRFNRDGETPPPFQVRLPAADPSASLSPTAAEELAAVDAASEIARLLEDERCRIGEQRVEAKDIAVLVRFHSQAERMAGALREWGIHSVQVSKQSVFSTREAAGLQQVLRAVAHPGNESLIRAALCTPLFEEDATGLLELQEDEERWMEVVDRFRRWNEAWDTHGFGYLFQSLLLEGDVARHLMRGARGERRVTNLVHLGELIQERERRSGRGHRSLLKWIGRKRAEENGEAEEDQLRLESDENLVRIVTMHRSKGLEYPIVFCPFLWRGSEFKETGMPLRYHEDGEGDVRAVLDLRTKRDAERGARRFLQAREELAESLRLAYVAMTRASHRCCVTWIAAGYPEFSALGYLLHQPDMILQALERKVGDQESNAPELEPFPAALRQLAGEHPDLLECVRPELPEPHAVRAGEGAQKPGEARTFHRTAPGPAFRISSFSSLTGAAHGEEELPGLEYLFGEEGAPAGETGEEGESVFTFPRGPRPGTCLHNIFEKLMQRGRTPDEKETERLIVSELRAFGISARWEPVARQIVRNTLRKELEPGTESPPAGAGPIRLGDLPEADRLPEMEFHFRAVPATGRELLAAIRGGEKNLPPLEEVPEGYLKGFIDLTFRHGGRYYLLDYKSNYLGDTAGEYHREALREEMRSACYDLQYHLYTVALHRYLSRRLPDYRYGTHFGGAWYLFVRGIHAEGEEGIWFDRPLEQTIRTLDRMLGGEER